MKVYLDLVMFINFFLDFLLIMGVSILLKRNVKLGKIIFGAFLGGLSILILFYPMNSFMLFLFKFVISIIMILTSFGYKSFKYTFMNLLYLYILSIFLGGFLYFLNDQFSIKKSGLVFINNGFSVTILFILIISPIVIYFYVKMMRSFKVSYSNYYNVEIYYNDFKIDCVGYLDSGNSLSYLGSSVILLDKRKLIFDVETYLFVPYETISGSNIVKCFKPSEIIINNVVCKKILVGIIDNVIIDGVDVILNNNIKEII